MTVIAEAKKKAERARDYWSALYEKARADLWFLSDEEGCQWDDADFESRRRKGRPALQIDMLRQFVNQVVNDIRMNTPTINVLPHSGGADIETSEIMKGMIRDIEQDSSADDAYDYAVSMSVKCGIGFIRVDHDYVGSGMDQQLTIERVVNPFAILLDPDSVEPDGSDATCAFVLDEISESSFKERWPDADVSSFGFEGSSDKDGYVTVCEYFQIDAQEVTIAQLDDGSVVDFQEGLEGVLRTRNVFRKTVRRYWLSGDTVLEETTFPGEYIPIIPVYGEEMWVDGKRHCHSLIRKAKDPQRRYNYWASVEAELLMKAPKATVVAAGGSIEQYADDYLDPDKATVLRYQTTDSSGNPVAPPQFLPGPGIPAGIVTAMQQARSDIQATLGLYDAFIGQRSNETSGVAIQQRKMEGDRAVYHFGDNLVKAITQVGRVLVSAIPTIYDTPRMVRIIDAEEESEEVGLNGMIAPRQERTFDLSQGQYSVRVTTGASFATMRQEAADFFQQVIQSQPQLMGVAGDLMFRFMDFPGAQALAERVKKTIPPHLLEEGNDPQVMALQQENQQLQQAIQQLQAEAMQIQQALEDKQTEIQLKAQETVSKSQDAQAKHQIEIEKLRLDERQMEIDYQLKIAEIALKEREIALKEQESVVDAVGQYARSEMPQSGGF